MKHKRYGDLSLIAKKTDGNCHICHKPAPIKRFGSPSRLGRSATTIDHIQCQVHGGTDAFENLMLAHAGCNSSRGTRSVEIARMQWAGTTRKPWSTATHYSVAGATCLGLGWIAGNYYAYETNDGYKQFDWTIATKTAVGAFGLFCILRALSK